MHTRISPDNPYAFDRYGFAWETTPAGGPAHLDFGCHDGAFLNSIAAKGVSRLVGVDISCDAVRDAAEKYPQLEVHHLENTVPLPFSDATFSSVSILDVLEHIAVDEQTALLNEIRRVLRDDGSLIVTLPGQHIFSILDRGNFKFRFPSLHRWYYCRKHSKEEYEYRFVNNPDGLIGDISSKKRWHEHFSRRRLKRLLELSGFTPVEFDGAGSFQRLVSLANLFLRWCQPIQPVVSRFQAWDRKSFESTHLFCIARKI